MFIQENCVMSSKIVFGLIPVLWLAGCSNPADNVPKAAVSNTNAAPGEAAKRAAPENDGKFFAFGPDSSSVDFVGSKVTGSHKGGFKKFAGEFRVVNGKLAES